MRNILLTVLSFFLFNVHAQNEIELNVNGPVIPLGNYAKSNLFYGMETIGYAEIGYGFDFKFLHKFNNSRFKIGAGVNYFQNPYKYKKLDVAFINNLGCDEDPFICGFDNYFGWDVLYKISDWKNIDVNLISGFNVLETKKIQYNILIGGGASMIISPKYFYNLSFDDELESHVSLSFNFSTEQNVRLKLTEKLFFNASLAYRISKVHSKFTKNLVDEFVYFDFWQQTLTTKFGLVYVLD